MEQVEVFGLIIFFHKPHIQVILTPALSKGKGV